MNKETKKLIKESQRFFKEDYDPATGTDPDASTPENVGEGEGREPEEGEAGTGVDASADIPDFSDEVTNVMDCEEGDLDDVFGQLSSDLNDALDNGQTKMVVNIEDVLELLNGYIEDDENEEPGEGEED
jgi:hypothetical protein